MKKQKIVWHRTKEVVILTNELLLSNIRLKRKNFVNDFKYCQFLPKKSNQLIKSIILIFLLFLYYHTNNWLSLIFDHLKFNVNAFSAYITENVSIDIAISIVTFLFPLIYFLYRINDNRYWSKTKFISLLISFYQFLPRDWSFAYSISFPKLCYIEYISFSILIIESGHFIIRGIQKWMNNINRLKIGKGFIVDNPFDHNNSDLSGINREKFTRDIANRIRDTNTNLNAFAVGITGVWGSGKSTFMDNLKNKLSTDSIIIEFSPWFSKTKDQVITDFFTYSGAYPPTNSGRIRSA